MAAPSRALRIDEILEQIPLTDPSTIPDDGDDADAYVEPEPDPGPPSGGAEAPPRPVMSMPVPQRHLHLSKAQRIGARDRAMRAAALAVQHSAHISYSQGSDRWDGIRRRCRASKGQFPHAGDCSSFTTWCLWDALLMYDAPDVINGSSWTAGYTGTQLEHGKPVTGSVMRGDLAIYGNGAPGKHVAICIGNGLVISHGSQAGPMKVKLHYRRDLMEVRRYI